MAGKHHDLVNFTKKYKGESHSFYLNMKNWRKFKSRYNLMWEKVKFAPSNRSAIPKERGIYAFVLELSPTKLPPHGYILYVGITGDDSNSNLYKRYGQYLLAHRNQDGRPAVYYMMDNWSEELFFHFVPLPNINIDLAKMERAFINAVLPPVNKRDIDAKITSAKAAVF